jgi:PqqD family protein of HPr-rel-A system
MFPDLKRLKSLEISKTGFLFDPATGHTYTLNNIAREMILLLREGSNRAELKNQLARKYDVADAVLEKDIHDLIEQLREFGF